MSSINIQGHNKGQNYAALQITNYSIFRTIKINKYIFMKQSPRQNYEPDQVVFIKDVQKNVNPAKIIKKSCYGTYKVSIYGSRLESFASEYQIEPFSKQRAMVLSLQQKKNKKYQKFLKSAEKDHEIFLEKTPLIQKLPRICKQQEQQMEEEMNNQMNSNKKHSRYQTVMNIKISNLIEDFNDEKQIACVYLYNGSERMFYKTSKQILMMKLQWALEDIYIEQSNQYTQTIIQQIMNTDFIEPIEYVTTELFDKLGLAIEYLKKNKKAKLKNYLIGKQISIIAGVENYLNNYSLFLRVKQNYDKWANGTDKTDKDDKVDQNLSLSYLDLMK